MSDHSDSSESLFSPAELQQFEADDVTAGSAIGKMLSWLFLYTVVAMSIVSWWTYSAFLAEQDSGAQTEHVEHH